MTDDSIPRCILLAALIIAGGVFSGAETAFSYCSRARLKSLASDRGGAAKRVVAILEQYDKTIITLNILINIIQVSAAAVSTSLAVSFLGSMGTLVATAGLTVLVFFFSETIPKNIAKANSDAYAMAVSFILKPLLFIMTPVSAVFNFLGDLLKKLFRRGERAPSMTEDELQTIIENVEEQGVIEPEESRIIRSAIEFGDLRARDVMTGRERIVALDGSLPANEIKRILLKEKFSRLPVYRGDLDHIIGIVQSRDYLRNFIKNETAGKIEDIVLSPYRVPPDIKLGALFEGMTRRRTHLAVVTGIGGITLGVVTMDDILKEIVGESLDDDDELDLPPIINQRRCNNYIATNTNTNTDTGTGTEDAGFEKMAGARAVSI